MMSGEEKDYELGTEGMKFNLRNGDLELKQPTVWKGHSYRDEEGNEISRERFYELKVENLEGRVLSLEDEISSLYTLIGDKADALNIVNAINCSPEGIRIKGDKIEINGETLIENRALDNKDLSVSLKLGEKEFADCITKYQSRSSRRSTTS
ncbi:hypothetical protein [Oceanobacillus sp. FSL W7-1281]|uniref:hypothetical protein n=1 Tax=Oceanobacillus sp. FSL W7-1281 TaxID=2921698 RepID=UPI0030D8ADB8